MRLEFAHAVFAVMFLTVAVAHAQRTPPTVEIDKYITAKMAEYKMPGLSVAVVRDGKVLHLKGYGVSNLELSTPVTAKTVFNLASVTKTFTALAVMTLVEQGKLSLDDPISKHLTGLPAAWNPVTIRQLLNHTSGIPSFAGFDKVPCPVGKQFREYARADVLKEVACLPLSFRPGEQWAYGDTGYHMLGMAIEQISGGPYEAYLRTRVFGPLGMKNTKSLSYSDLLPNRADGYSFENGVVMNARRFEIDEFASGGLVSTAEDMAKFEMAFTSEKVLRRRTLDLMRENARLADGKTAAYGLGLGLTPFRGKDRIGHAGGGGLGFATAFTYFPEHKTYVVLLSNADQPDGRIGSFANEIAAMYF